jgi:hypothetical protein
MIVRMGNKINKRLLRKRFFKSFLLEKLSHIRARPIGRKTTPRYFTRNSREHKIPASTITMYSNADEMILRLVFSFLRMINVIKRGKIAQRKISVEEKA